MKGMASSQSRNAGTGAPVKRMSSSANRRSNTASVISRAGKYIPPVVLASGMYFPAHPARRLGERLEQVALSLPTAAADDTQRRPRTRVDGERGQRRPFGIPVEDVTGLDHQASPSQAAEVYLTEVYLTQAYLGSSRTVR